MASNNRFRGGARRGPSTGGYAASLPHSVQISNQIALMNTLKGGHDIRNWSLSARKELALAGNVSLLVAKEPTPEEIEASARMGNKFAPKGKMEAFIAPRLSMAVTSPLLREFLEMKPNATEVEIANPRITRDALRALTNWMKAVTHVPKMFDIPYPEDDFAAALDIRVAGEALGMGQYVKHIVEDYCSSIGAYVPQPDEALVVIEHAIGDQDALLIALADRMVQLFRINDEEQFSRAEQLTWDAELQRPELESLYSTMEELDKLQDQTKLQVDTQTAEEKEAARIAEARKHKLARKAAEKESKEKARLEAEKQFSFDVGI